MDATQRLTNLLGDYLDLEKDLVDWCEHLLDGAGLVIRLPFKSIKLFNNHEFQEFLPTNFLILNEHHRLRGHLRRPYLFIDEVYEIEFFSTLASLPQKLVIKPLDPWEVEIVPETLPFWTGVLKEGWLHVRVRRQQPGKLRDQIFLLEHFLGDYVTTLKQGLAGQFQQIKIPELKKERAELFIQPGRPEDLGIKDLLLLRQIFINFHLSLSNEELLKADEETITYRTQLLQLQRRLKLLVR